MSESTKQEKKGLEVGINYGACFGLKEDSGQKMMFLGGDKWRAVCPGKDNIEAICHKTTATVLEYINRPGRSAGCQASMMRG